MFNAPSDATRLAEWERDIKREDRRLTPAAVVCEKHFESSCIERTFSVSVNGVTSELPRDKPRLKPDAVPSIFTHYPEHILPKVSAKRKARNLCQQEPPEKRHRRAASEASELCSGIDNAESVSMEASDTNSGAAVTERCTTPRCVSAEGSAGEAQNADDERPRTTNDRLYPFSNVAIPVT